MADQSKASSKPHIIYVDHIEFVCIMMDGNGMPDESIPPRAYTMDQLSNAIYAYIERVKIENLRLYEVHTDEDGDIWMRVANPQT